MRLSTTEVVCPICDATITLGVSVDRWPPTITVDTASFHAPMSPRLTPPRPSPSTSPE